MKENNLLLEINNYRRLMGIPLIKVKKHINEGNENVANTVDDVTEEEITKLRTSVEAKIAFEAAHEAKEKAALKAKEDFVRKAKEFKDTEGETKKERSRSKSVEKSSNNNWILGVGLLAAAAFVTIKVLSKNRDQ